MLFSNFDENPIIQILSLSIPKWHNTGNIPLDDLSTTTSFHQFSKEELNSLFMLLTNGQSLPVLQNEFKFKSDVNISSLMPIYENLQNQDFIDQLTLKMMHFYVSRCVITVLSQQKKSVSASSLNKIFQLIVFVIKSFISNEPNQKEPKNIKEILLLKRSFLLVLNSFVEKVNLEVLPPIQSFFDDIEIDSSIEKEALDVLILMMKTILNQHSEIDEFLYKTSSKIILDFKNKELIQDQLNNSVLPHLKKFNQQSISYLANLISIIDFTEIEPFLMKIPENLFNYSTESFYKNHINSDSMDVENSNPRSVLKVNMSEINGLQQFPFGTFDTFHEKIHKTKLAFQDNYHFPKELVAILNDLRKIAESLPRANEIFAKFFFSMIENDSPKLYDIAIMAIMICENEELNLKILHSKIFDPRFSLFNDCDNTDINVIFNVRQICLKNMKGKYNVLPDYLLSIHQYPLLVADIFEFLYYDIPDLSKLHGTQRNAVLFATSKISGDYQLIHVHHKLPNKEKEIEYTRTSLIHFSLELFTKYENSQYCIVNVLYMQMLISYLHEPKIRYVVLKALEVACSCRELDLGVCLSEFFKNLIQSTENNDLRRDSIISLNKIIQVIPEYKNYFDLLVEPLIDSLNTLTHDEKSQTFVNEVIKFVSLASQDYYTAYTDKILESIQKIEGQNPSQETFKTLLQAISGEAFDNNNDQNNSDSIINSIINNRHNTKSSQFKAFEIKHPVLLAIFVKSFQNSEKFVDILILLKNLCAQSRDNAIACHLGKVDLLIIEILKELKVNKEDNTHIVGPATQLFISIANIASSVEVVRSFFSLFTEIDDHVISLYQSLFYITLSDLITTEMGFPVSLPLQQNAPIIQIQGISGKVLNNGFTISFWAYLSDMTNSLPKFFSIYDDKRKGIECYGQNKSIKVKINYGEAVETVKLNFTNIEINNWNYLVLSFSNHNGLFSISAYIKSLNQTIQNYTCNTFEFERYGQLTMIFGGVLPSIQNGLDKSSLGNINLSALLDSNEMVNHRIDSIEANNYQNPKNIISILMDKQNDNLMINTLSSASYKLTAKLVGPQCIVPISFGNVVVENNLMMLMFQLLTQNKCKYIDGSAAPTQFSIIFIVLNSLIKSSERAQVLLHESKGIDCLAHILAESDDEIVNFHLYQNIHLIFEKARYIPLKLEILEKLLLNSEIWVNSDGVSHLQICRDWSRDLVPKYEKYTSKFLTFYIVLRKLRIYYWYTPAENKLICTKRHEDTPIFDIRSSLLQILHVISLKSFASDELSCLISHLVGIKDSKQVVELLNFAKLLMVSPDTPLRNIENLWSHFSKLHFLMNSDNDNVIYGVIDLFLTLHYLNYIEKPKVSNHVYVLTNMVPRIVYTNNFFVNFFPLAMKYSDVMPLVFYLGMKMSETELKIITTNIQPDPKFSAVKYWDLMPILFALKYGGDKIEFIANYLAICSKGDWDKIYQMIYLISTVFNLDCGDFISSFLEKVCYNIINTPSLFHFELLHNFFDVAILHIFFRKNNGMNNSLINEFQHSPFTTECPENVYKQSYMPELNHMLLFDEIKKQYTSLLKSFGSQIPSNSSPIKNNAQNTSGLTFSIRLDKNGHWLDIALAKRLIEISMMTKVQTFHNVSALCLAFLYQVDKSEETIQKIDALFTKKVMDQAYSDFLTRIFKNPGQKSSSDCFEMIVRDTMIPNSKIVNGIHLLASKLMKLSDKIKEETKDINSKTSKKDEYYRAESREMRSEVYAIKATSDLYAKEWDILEEKITSKGAPFEKSYRATYPGENEQSKFERDNFYSDFECPVKFQIIKPSKLKRIVEEHQLGSATNQKGKHLNHAKIDYPSQDGMIKVNRASFSGNRHKLDKKSLSMHAIQNPTTKNIFSSGFYDKQTPSEILQTINTPVIYWKYPSKKINFVVEGSKIQLIDDSGSIVYKEFKATDIVEMVFMPVHNQAIGVEIICKNTKRYFVNFILLDSLEILKNIDALITFKTVMIQTLAPNFHFKALEITEKWIDGRISNFEYLICLNKYSGKSFICFENYPVFPLLLDDFNDITKLRDLSQSVDPEQKRSILSQDDVASFLHLLEPFKTMNNKQNQENTSNNNLSVQEGKLFSELPPEFYYEPRYFESDSITLPTWANSSSLEFIYQNRKLLEKSENLPLWIDLIFGVCREGNGTSYESSRNFPVQLFTTPHPKQSINFQKCSLSHKDEAHSPIFVINTGNSCNNYNYYSIYNLGSSKNNYYDNNSNVHTFSCIDRITGVVYKVFVDLEKNIINSKDTWTKLNGSSYTAYGQKELIYINNEFNMKSFNVESSEMKDLTGICNTLKNNKFGMNCTNSDFPYYVIGGNDSNITIYNAKDTQHDNVKVLPTFRDELKCIDVSASFCIISAVTNDHYMMIMNANNGRVESSFEMDHKYSQEKLIISPKWGFINVYCEEIIDQINNINIQTRDESNENISTKENNSLNSDFKSEENSGKPKIEVFTHYGKHVKTIDLKFKVKSWATFSSSHDFDFIVAADEYGRIFSFEIYGNEEPELIAKLDKDISFIHVTYPNLHAVTFSRNGDIDVIPIEEK
ncbi:hypothetical protein TRFO_20271 [Tritrichomonas foetus]|uniref:BEACH domain-containing protein n=1 Tax=Tritrichomonas foetus TaxID=1144522 RepID=A0A1J4KGE7_9EUKA|nr:hypothetical protein TRFO_20271 [Tritrichomonas foetus]|eukprot:OHT10457.1 hypothetical protein TRFO_20271 [Tritrichomonas foetus]